MRHTLTSLLVQHNQSPDASIFALFPRDDHMTEAAAAAAGRGGEKRWESEVSNEAARALGIK